MKILIKTFLLFFVFISISFSQEEDKEKKYFIPPYTINFIIEQEFTPKSESYPGFLTNRGEFQKLKRLSGNGKGIKVGIVDTGLDYTHSRSGGELELGKAVIEVKDFSDSRTRRGYPSWVDNAGHGTHVAGHIGARANGVGIEGIASECDLYIAKGLGDRSFGTETMISNSIVWLISKDVDIINLSIGGGYASRIEAAIKLARSKGILVFAAMGNESTNTDNHPGNSKYTFGITAIDYQYRVAPFSSRSNMADFSGFGVNIFSTINNGRYAEFSGTSMSSPDQAGIAALILGYSRKIGKPIEGMDEYLNFVLPGTADLGVDGKDVEYGYGFIVLDKLIKENESQPPITPEEPEIIPDDPFGPITPEEPSIPIIPAPPIDPFENYKKVGEMIIQGKKYILLEEK